MFQIGSPDPIFIVPVIIVKRWYHITMASLECHFISHHRQLDFLFQHIAQVHNADISMFRYRWLFCEEKPLVPDGFPSQRASNTGGASMSWHLILPQHFTLPHDDVIKWIHSPRYWPFVREIQRSPWLPLTKAGDAELWCFLWSAPD